LRNAKTDTAGGSGNQGNLALQKFLLCHFSLLVGDRIG